MSDYKIEGRQSTIFRVVKNKNNPYVMMDKRPLKNKKLSYKAKGILAYLLSLPDGFEINMTDLKKHGTERVTALRSGLKELQRAGHVVRNTRRVGGYIKKWVIEVYEVPIKVEAENKTENAQSPKPLESGNLKVGNLKVGNLQVGNHPQVIKEFKGIKKSSNNNPPAAAADFTEHQREVYQFCVDELRYKPETAAKKAEQWHTPVIFREELEKLAKLKGSQPAKEKLQQMRAEAPKKHPAGAPDTPFAQSERAMREGTLMPLGILLAQHANKPQKEKE